MTFLSSIISLVREGLKPLSSAAALGLVRGASLFVTRTKGRQLERGHGKAMERLSLEGGYHGFHQGRVLLGRHRAGVEEELVVLDAADHRRLAQA